jgi:DNA-binding SARP family transcriptional activator
MLWPTSAPTLGLRSLNSLVYNLHKLLGPALGSAAPVLHEDGYYQLNVEAGIGVDVVYFDRLVEEGDQLLQVGNEATAIAAYHRAAELYRGGLCIAVDAQTVMERERLLSQYLTLLMQLAEHAYNAGDYGSSLTYLWQLLARDSYREDAHRLVMRCHVRRGERGAALRQYQVCVDLLRAEFDATPERATVALFEQIRLAPDTI